MLYKSYEKQVNIRRGLFELRVSCCLAGSVVLAVHLSGLTAIEINSLLLLLQQIGYFAATFNDTQTFQVCLAHSLPSMFRLKVMPLSRLSEQITARK